MTDFLPYGRQSIDDDDIEAVVAVLKSDFLTTGPIIAEFEAGLGKATGADHVIACSNGTTALHLILAGLGIGPGDIVIVPAMTFMSTANVVLHAGAEVIFCDVDPETGLMGVDNLDDAVSRARGPVKAVIPVHLNGAPADLAGLREVADKGGFRLIADACHGLGGSDQQGNRLGCGQHEHASYFSFHPVKSIATGEGGAVTTNDPTLANRMRQLVSHGIVRDPSEFKRRDMAITDGEGDNPWYHEMQMLGFNYRLSDIQAALGCSQLKKLDGFIARRQALAAQYDALLGPLANLVHPVPIADKGLSARHLYPVLIDFPAAGMSRRAVMLGLKELGIGTQVHYIPVNEQPFYRERYGAGPLAGANRYYARVLSLPLFPAMLDGDPERVVDALRSVLKV